MVRERIRCNTPIKKCEFLCTRSKMQNFTMYYEISRLCVKGKRILSAQILRLCRDGFIFRTHYSRRQPSKKYWKEPPVIFYGYFSWENYVSSSGLSGFSRGCFPGRPYSTFSPSHIHTGIYRQMYTHNGTERRGMIIKPHLFSGTT